MTENVVHLFDAATRSTSVRAEGQEDEPKLLLPDDLDEDVLAEAYSTAITGLQMDPNIEICCLHTSKKQRKKGARYFKEKTYITECFDTPNLALHALDASVRWRKTIGENQGEFVFKMESNIPNCPYEIPVAGRSPSLQLLKALFDEIYIKHPQLYETLRSNGIKPNTLSSKNRFITDRIFLQAVLRLDSKGNIIPVVNKKQNGEIRLVETICMDRTKYFRGLDYPLPRQYAQRNEIEIEYVPNGKIDPYENGSAGSSSPDIPPNIVNIGHAHLLGAIYKALPPDFRPLLSRTMDNKASYGLNKLNQLVRHVAEIVSPKVA